MKQRTRLALKAFILASSAFSRSICTMDCSHQALNTHPCMLQPLLHVILLLACYTLPCMFLLHIKPWPCFLSPTVMPFKAVLSVLSGKATAHSVSSLGGHEY